MSYETEGMRRILFMLFLFVIIYLIMLLIQYFLEIRKENEILWRENERLNEDIAFYNSSEMEMQREIKSAINNFINSVTPNDKKTEPKSEN